MVHWVHKSLLGYNTPDSLQANYSEETVEDHFLLTLSETVAPISSSGCIISMD